MLNISISWLVIFVQFWIFFFLGSAFRASNRASNPFLGWGRRIPNKYLGQLTDWSAYRIIIGFGVLELLPLGSCAQWPEGVCAEVTSGFGPEFVFAIVVGMTLGITWGWITRFMDRVSN